MDVAAWANVCIQSSRHEVIKLQYYCTCMHWSITIIEQQPRTYAQHHPVRTQSTRLWREKKTKTNRNNSTMWNHNWKVGINTRNASRHVRVPEATMFSTPGWIWARRFQWAVSMTAYTVYRFTDQNPKSSYEPLKFKVFRGQHFMCKDNAYDINPYLSLILRVSPGQTHNDEQCVVLKTSFINIQLYCAHIAVATPT